MFLNKRWTFLSCNCDTKQCSDTNLKVYKASYPKTLFSVWHTDSIFVNCGLRSEVMSGVMSWCKGGRCRVERSEKECGSDMLSLCCSVEWLVVDESDKLFEEGKKGFREQLATIFLACSSPHVRRALFSATFALDVEQWCRLNLDNLVSVNIGQR